MTKSDLSKEEIKKKYFVENISPIMQLKTVQIIFIREVHDYTILRTEEDRELNTVEIPKSFSNPEPELHIAFLGSKQKAVENRAYRALIQTSKPELKTCIIPSDLCLECPRCTLFGAVNTSISEYNIKHRINYSTAFSLQSFEVLNEIIQFNAVNEKNQLTGQALGVSHNIKPLAIFPSIISLNSVSYEEFLLVLKTLIATKNYGAETRIKGTFRNRILGIVFGYEEIITSLELTLELNEKLNNKNNKMEIPNFHNYTKLILEKYMESASMKDKIHLLSVNELETFLKEVSSTDIDPLVSMVINQSKLYINSVKDSVSSKKSKKKKVE